MSLDMDDICKTMFPDFWGMPVERALVSTALIGLCDEWNKHVYCSKYKDKERAKEELCKQLLPPDLLMSMFTLVCTPKRCDQCSKRMTVVTSRQCSFCMEGDQVDDWMWDLPDPKKWQFMHCEACGIDCCYSCLDQLRGDDALTYNPRDASIPQKMLPKYIALVAAERPYSASRELFGMRMIGRMLQLNRLCWKQLCKRVGIKMTRVKISHATPVDGLSVVDRALVVYCQMFTTVLIKMIHAQQVDGLDLSITGRALVAYREMYITANNRTTATTTSSSQQQTTQERREEGAPFLLRLLHSQASQTEATAAQSINKAEVAGEPLIIMSMDPGIIRHAVALIGGKRSPAQLPALQLIRQLIKHATEFQQTGGSHQLRAQRQRESQQHLNRMMDLAVIECDCLAHLPCLLQQQPQDSITPVMREEVMGIISSVVSFGSAEHMRAMVKSGTLEHVVREIILSSESSEDGDDHCIADPFDNKWSDLVDTETHDVKCRILTQMVKRGCGMGWREYMAKEVDTLRALVCLIRVENKAKTNVPLLVASIGDLCASPGWCRRCGGRFAVCPQCAYGTRDEPKMDRNVVEFSDYLAEKIMASGAIPLLRNMLRMENRTGQLFDLSVRNSIEHVLTTLESLERRRILESASHKVTVCKEDEEASGRIRQRGCMPSVVPITSSVNSGVEIRRKENLQVFDSPIASIQCDPITISRFVRVNSSDSDAGDDIDFICRYLSL